MRTGKRQMQISDLAGFEYISSPDVSPDGENAVFVVQVADLASGGFRSSVFETDTTIGQAVRLTDCMDHADLPKYSPDGTKIAFLSDKSGDKQIWLFDRQTKKGQMLTTFRHGVNWFCWSNDGKHIALETPLREHEHDIACILLTNQERAEKQFALEDAPIVIEELMYKSDEAGFDDGSKTQIAILEVATRLSWLVTKEHADHHFPCWSKDGLNLVFYGSPYADDKAGSKELFISRVDGSEYRQLTKDSLMIASSPAIYGETHIYFGSYYKEENGTFSHQLYAVEPDGGESFRVLPDSEICYGLDSGSIGKTAMGRQNPSFALSDCERYIYFSSGFNGAVMLYRLDLQSQSLERVIEGSISIHSFCVPKNNHIVFVKADVLTPAELYSFDLETKSETRLTITNTWLDEIALSKPHEMWVETKDKTSRIHGFVVPPLGLVKGERYPAVLDIHGGPEAFYSYDFWFELQYLAACGFAVVYCDPRGSSGFGMEHCKSEHAWGQNSFDDLMTFLDASIELGFIDEDSLGVTGGSYGGQMTNRMICGSQRFKAAVTQRNLCNLTTSYGTGDIGFVRSDKSFTTMLKMLTERAKSRSSVINKIDRIKTPLLILHGTNDYRCSFEQAEQLFIAMKDRNPEVSVKLIAFPGENHSITRSGKLHFQQTHLNEMKKWFEEYLKEPQSKMAGRVCK